MKNAFLKSLLMVLTTTAVIAQNSNNPWLVSGGINVLSLQNDFSNPLNDNQVYQKEDFPSTNLGVPSLSIFRTIKGGLALGTQFSLNSLNRETKRCLEKITSSFFRRPLYLHNWCYWNWHNFCFNL